MAEEQNAAAATFTKEQLLAAKTYESRRDLLVALLQGGQSYTHEQVQSLLDKYLKGQVE